MNLLPKVTIVIPVYNGERFIKETLEAVVCQEYSNLEIIVVDNASEDSTCEIVSAFSSKGVKLIKNEKNLGMTGNFNRCLELADGDYLQILCSDDRISNDCISKKVTAMEANPTCAMCISATEIRNDSGKVLFKRKSFKKDRMISGEKMIKKSFRRYNLYGEPSNVMIKVSSISDGMKFNEEMYYAVDWEFWLRLSLKGDVYYINEPLSSFYARGDSETGSLLKKKKKIINDDKLLVKICRENKFMNINVFDCFMHSLKGRIRLYMKMIFSKIKKYM